MNSFKSPRLAALLAALLLAGATGTAIAAAKGKKPAGLERYGVAVYSDLCLQKDSGEIGGQRVTLHRFAEADSVIYEFTAGALSWPIVASDVNLDAATRLLRRQCAHADETEPRARFRPPLEDVHAMSAHARGARAGARAGWRRGARRVVNVVVVI